MAAYPPAAPPVPPPPGPPPGYDPRAYRRAMRDAIRAQRERLRFQMRSMRRHSILGPLLLIGLGVLFLLFQTGRVDQPLFWQRYGHWWPLLLLFAGVILLAEWIFDQFRLRDPNQPRYRRSVGGIAVLLLVFFVLAGIFASEGFRFRRPPDTMILHGLQLTPDSLDELFGDKHDSDQTLDFPLSASGTFAVVNPRGDVTISGTSDDSRIHVAIHKQVYASSDSEADSKAQQLTPATADYGSGMTLTMPSLDGARADLSLTVPAAAAITVTANHGDIHINSIKATVTATANHGDIELSAISGQATAHINSAGSSLTARSLADGITVEGHAQDVTLTDITGPISVSGDFFGTTHFEHINGPIKFHTSRANFQLARLDGEAEISPRANLSADQGVGPLVFVSNNHNITLDRISGDINVTDHNGSIDLTAAAPLGRITLEDRNGSIRATMPEHASFVVQANTTNGQIDNDLQLTPWGTGSSKSLTGTVGAGGPQLTITTTNGDISIHKADVQPMPPNPPTPPKVTLEPSATPAPAQPAKPHKKPASSAPAAPVASTTQ
jgi:DUF4097 and DUF4098 domain-containing protein YvlB